MSDKKLLKNCPLKNCPFCGGKAETYEYESSRDIYDSDTLGYVDTEYFTKYGVACTLCNCLMAEYKSEEKAIEAWNERKPTERIVEQLDRMKSKPIELCYDVLLIDSIIEIVKEEGELND